MSRYPIASLEIQITRTTIFNRREEVLLSNPRNKQRFVKLLSSALTESGIRCVNCEDDADVEIVEAVMTIALEKSVCVLADDADITIQLIHKIFERLSSGVSLLNIYQLRVGVVYDMVAVTNVLPTALKTVCCLFMPSVARTPLLDYIITGMLQLQPIRYRRRLLQTFFTERIRQCMTFSPPEIIL